MNKKHIKFVRDDEGVSELMKSEEMQSVLAEFASNIYARLDSKKGYEMKDPIVGKKRANVTIRTASAHAYYSNLKHNSLLKALK